MAIISSSFWSSGVVNAPEEDAHSLVFGVIHDLLEVDGVGPLHQVVLVAPALVEVDVFEAVAGGEVDEILIGIGVDSCLEVHPGEVQGAPPVPGHLAGLHPGKVDTFSLRIAEQVHQLGRAARHPLTPPHHPPGEFPRAGRAGDVIGPLFHDEVEFHVSPGFVFGRVFGKGGFQSAAAGRLAQVKARVVFQGGLGDHGA
jgi:hypothetical protein